MNSHNILNLSKSHQSTNA